MNLMISPHVNMVERKSVMVASEARSLIDTYMEQLLKQLCSHYTV